MGTIEGLNPWGDKQPPKPPRTKSKRDEEYSVEEEFGGEEEYEEIEEEDDPFADLGEARSTSTRPSRSRGRGYSAALQLSFDDEEDDLPQEEYGDEDEPLPDEDLLKLVHQHSDLLGPDEEDSYNPVAPERSRDLGIFANEIEEKEAKPEFTTSGHQLLPVTVETPDPQASIQNLRQVGGVNYLSTEPRHQQSRREPVIEAMLEEKPPRDFDFKKIDPMDLPSGALSFLVSCGRLGLTSDQINALMSAASNDPELKIALDKLVGKASIAQGVAGSAANVDALSQEIAVQQEKPLAAGNASRAVLFERLKKLVNDNAVIMTGMDLETPLRKGSIPGSPQLLGKVAAISLWHYKSVPDSRSLEKRNDRNGALFCRTILSGARSRNTKEGDYLVFAYTLNVNGREERAYCLTPVIGADCEIKYPSSKQETACRLIHGIVDGIVIQDKDKSDRYFTYADAVPFLLECKMIPRKGGGGPGALVMENGQSLRTPSMRMYFLEPATVLSSYGSDIQLTPTGKPSAELEGIIQARENVQRRAESQLLAASGHRAQTDGRKGPLSWY